MISTTTTTGERQWFTTVVMSACVIIVGPTCSPSGRGTLATYSTTTPSSWTTYSYNYTAITALTTLLFGFESEAARLFHLDDVSVVNVNQPNVQLLANPSFENSSSTPNGWRVWCLSTCSSSSTQISSNSNCYASSGRCFQANCAFGIGFVGQSFPTMIGDTYTISFRLIARWGLLTTNKFDVDVV